MAANAGGKDLARLRLRSSEAPTTANPHSASSPAVVVAIIPVVPGAAVVGVGSRRRVNRVDINLVCCSW